MEQGFPGQAILPEIDRLEVLWSKRLIIAWYTRENDRPQR